MKMIVPDEGALSFVARKQHGNFPQQTSTTPTPPSREKQSQSCILEGLENPEEGASNDTSKEPNADNFQGLGQIWKALWDKRQRL
jgi:hypothetical protein